MPRVPLRFAIPAAVLLSILLLPASAGAAGWVTGPALSPTGRVATEPQVAVTASGERIVAWEQNRAEENGSQREGIGVRAAPPGGDFGPAQLLGDSSVNDASLTAGGDLAAVVWSAGDNLHIARRAPGEATFSEVPPFALGARALSPVAVVIEDGDVYVAITTEALRGANVDSTVRVLRLADGADRIDLVPGTGVGGVLDAASFNRDTQPELRVADPDIAVSGGTIHVVWEQLLNGVGANDGRTRVRRATAPLAGGNFTLPIPVDDFTARSSFRADRALPQAVAGAGRMVVAWARGSDREVRSLDLAGPLGVQRLATPGFPFGVRAGIDGSGSAVLSWEETPTTDFAFVVFGLAVAPDRPPGSPQRLTPPNTNQVLDDLVAGPDGSVLVLANRRREESNGSFDGRVTASLRPPDGEFGVPENVSGPHERTEDSAFDQASGALGSDGRALVAWTADDLLGTRTDRLFLSERDVASPVIGGVIIPRAAAVETPVALAVTATDALSATTVIWDFGDGSRGRGASVEHAYGAPGDYTVTVTVRDGVDNVASESRPISIAPVPPPAPPAAAGGGGSPGAAPPDRTAPAVTRVRSANKRFRIGSRATQLIAAGKRNPAGTRFSLGVNERATLVIVFTGKLPGRRSGTRCVLGRRSGRRCNVAVEPGTIIRSPRGPGDVSIPFTGRVGTTRLAPGSYKASVTAIDAAGNRSRPAAVSFTVVSR